MFSFRRFFKLRSTGYLELGKRVYRKIIEAECLEHAAAMAFYVLFAIFPFFLFLATAIGYLHIPYMREYVLNSAEKMLPDQVFDLLRDNIRVLFDSRKTGTALARISSSPVGFGQSRYLHDEGHE